MDVNRKFFKCCIGIVFLGYLSLLFYVLFFSEMFGRIPDESGYRYNLTLFREIRRYYYVGIYHENWKLFFLNVVGNVLAFLPFGLLLPMLFQRAKKCFILVLYSFEFSLFVELVQLVTRVGHFDVDDLLLNTIGGLTGYFLYILGRNIWHRGKKDLSN